MASLDSEMTASVGTSSARSAGEDDLPSVAAALSQRDDARVEAVRDVRARDIPLYWCTPRGVQHRWTVRA